ncbi:MAG TPA: type II toxin-antitoxin system VapC family toxin [Ktedonobacterales bacterium]|nr:type II toxin-antitoxin system VapC family toxin [Ktedonobacterales bacterium]
MATYYFDTNALIKLYIFDTTSYWAVGVESQKTPQNRLIVSEIARVEIPSAMYKIGRINPNVDVAEIDLGIRRFKRHMSAGTNYRRSRFTVSILNETVLNQADILLEKYRTGQPKALHSLDALHLASAMIIRNTLPEPERASMVFVSADKQLRGCAQNEGFEVIDPNNP